jgi:hypothetical protein
MHKQQHTLELQRQARNSLHNPQLLTPLLGHPSISQDQHIIAALQATSKQLQTAVTQQLHGQLLVVLCTDAPPKMHALALWLRKHTGLCQGLNLQIIHSSDKSLSFLEGGLPRVKDVRWPDAVAAIAKALQDAATAGNVALQSFSLAGSTADAATLQQIPSQQLTQLCAEIDFSSTVSLQAVAALTGLRSLQLTVAAHSARHAADDVLAPLAAALQQLTQLHVGPVWLAQLQQLPAKLQQLHVKIDLDRDLQQLVQLADWLQQHSSIIKSLGLQGGPRGEVSATYVAAMDSLIAQIQAAAARDRDCLDSLCLERFVSLGPAGQVLQQLPACSLTRLTCSID